VYMYPSDEIQNLKIYNFSVFFCIVSELLPNFALLGTIGYLREQNDVVFIKRPLYKT
jgi:hypothetical protein